MPFNSRDGSWFQKHSKELIFMLLSVICFLVFYIISGQNLATDQVIAQVLLNLGIVFLSISVISLIWEGLGGEPVINAIKMMKSYAELSNLGIKRVSLRNEDYRFRKWQINIKESKRLYFIGNILRRWTQDIMNEIDDAIQAKLRSGDCEIKILILDPEGDSIKIRAFDEMCQSLPSSAEFDSVTLRNRRDRELRRMTTDIEAVLDYFNDLKKFDQNNSFLVRLVDKTYINSSIFIFDEEMIVMNYLHQTGTNSPLWEISGKNNKYYQIFLSEFNKIWRVSREYEFD
jgi:hypothetical protein